MRVKELIYTGGNLKRNAYLPEAEITRLIKTEKGVTSKVININLGEALRENPEHNIPLKEDDYLLVRQVPGWYIEKTVTLEGEEKFPGVYSFSKGERLSSVIERAGGFTEYAYLKGAFFTRESAKRIQEKRIKGAVDKLEKDMLRSQARLAEASVSGADAKGLEQSMVAKRDLLRKLKVAQATGRVVIVLDSLDKFAGSKYDLELEDGDTLTIPPMPWIVNVLGSVYNPTSIVYTRGKRADFYLSKVGGPTRDAEEGEMYIVKADGTVISKTQKGAFGLSWDSEGKRWVGGGFMAARIDPGDSILVPSKITRIVWKKELMDWTTILFQLAVTAGVIVALY
jgi:protein involved in polysaccharide export with SLBB domain